MSWAPFAAVFASTQTVRPVRQYTFEYSCDSDEDPAPPPVTAQLTAVSRLRKITQWDNTFTSFLPPLTFAYGSFDPSGATTTQLSRPFRRYLAADGSAPQPQSISSMSAPTVCRIFSTVPSLRGMAIRSQSGRWRLGSGRAPDDGRKPEPLAGQPGGPDHRPQCRPPCGLRRTQSGATTMCISCTRVTACGRPPARSRTCRRSSTTIPTSS